MPVLSLSLVFSILSNKIARTVQHDTYIVLDTHHIFVEVFYLKQIVLKKRKKKSTNKVQTFPTNGRKSSAVEWKGEDMIASQEDN